MLALALDGGQPSGHRIFSTGLAFSGPADQNTQVYSTAQPPWCQTPFCTFPVTQALVLLVVPPYSTSDPCKVLATAAGVYGTDAYSILARESAFHEQTKVKVPLLTVYAADDTLVQPFHAAMMAGYQAGNPLQLTLEVEAGNHAYFYDRWWQQRAMLLYLQGDAPQCVVTCDRRRADREQDRRRSAVPGSTRPAGRSDARRRRRDRVRIALHLRHHATGAGDDDRSVRPTQAASGARD